MSDQRQPTPPPSTQRDPRDGAQPPAIPSDSPANPVAVAILLSGNPAVTEAQAPGLLGAPIAQLLRDKRSVLYAKTKDTAAAPVKRPAGAVARPGEVVLIQTGAAPAKMPVKGAQVASTKLPGEPFLARLQLAGVGCAEWARMNALERGRAIRHIFYDTSRPGLSGDDVRLPPLPKNPDDLIPSIDDACAAAPAPAVAGTTTPAVKAEPNKGGRAVDWFLAQLQQGGVDCAAWARMSAVARLNTIRNFFYPGVSVSQSQADAAREQAYAAQLRLAHHAPERPEDLVSAVDDACGVAHAAAVAGPPSAPVALGAWAADAWARFHRIGITCDQWFARDRSAQWQMMLALNRQSLLPWWPGGRTWEEAMLALDRECLNRAEPASNSPADSIRARLRAILDCAALDAQDKLQQITVILRAFPEFNNDRRALYRLALARYDGCHPASEPGWAGQGFTHLVGVGNARRSLASGPQWVQEIEQAGFYTDVLEGDVRGMSLAQWVRQGPYMPPSGPDVFDPVQGATGDCYLIAAMAAVAWARPDALAQISQPLANGRRQFRLGDRQVEVSERTPCMILAGFAPLFARGSRLDAQWPGVLEKAFAARATGDTTDKPNIGAAVDNMFGPSDAIGQVRGITSGIFRSIDAIPLLAGGSLFWHLNYFRSDDAVFDLLATYCTPDGRARVPMVASTYPSGGFVDRTGLPANHVYTVLGYGFHADGRKFVVLRNPWGLASMGLPAEGFTVPVVGRWLNRLNLNHGDGGCFALAHGAFAAAFLAFYGAQ